MKRRLTDLVLASGAIVAPDIAFAQQGGVGSSIVIDPQLDRGDVAGARIEPAFQPRPIHIGRLFARPSISVMGGYESNVFNRPDPGSDAVLSLVPRLSVQTDLSRHDLSFTATGSFRRFARQQT